MRARTALDVKGLLHFGTVLLFSDELVFSAYEANHPRQLADEFAQLLTDAGLSRNHVRRLGGRELADAENFMEICQSAARATEEQFPDFLAGDKRIGDAFDDEFYQTLKFEGGEGYLGQSRSRMAAPRRQGAFADPLCHPDERANRSSPAAPEAVKGQQGALAAPQFRSNGASKGQS